MKWTPTAIQERIAVIDIIRGFALFGIFLVNMPAFHSPDLFMKAYDLQAEYSGLDAFVRLLFDMFVQGKFYTIFSFLFGLGFYLFMSRAEQKGLRTYWLFSRRLLVLLLFGSLHLVLLWYGDILLTYALTGFVLLLFYRRSDTAVLGWALGLIAVINVALGLLLFQSAPPSAADQQQIGWQKAAEAADVYNNGTYMEFLAFRWENEVPLVLGFLPDAILTVLPFFLLGLYAGRKGMLQHPERHQQAIKRVWLTSLVLSVPSVILIPLIQWHLVQFAASKHFASEMFVSLSGLTLCFFYISSILLLAIKGRWLTILRPLQYVGQMALTNYIGQTILSLLIILGGNWYGKISLTAGLLICLVVFPLQGMFSRFWLRRYRFGPLEWVWRSLTYGHRQPIKLRADR